MPLKKPTIENVANIKVVGIGGGGNAALNRMMEAKIKGVEFIAVNTDAQALHYSGAPVKLHIGQGVTRGLGAGMNPSVGQQAAEESREEIHDLLKGADMVFTTGGFGGGTCTGALPVITEIAKELGSLTVAVVTKPFTFEGRQRMTLAEEAVAELEGRADASVIIPNDRLMQIIDKKTSLVDAFRVVDDVLRQGVQGITDLITHHGMVNVDFADIRAIMQDAGSALMGIGRASGENRATEAARAAIESPMLDITIDGAKGIVFNITAGSDLRMHEVEEAARTITEHADPNAKVIFGAVMDDTEVEEGELKITVVATGFDKPETVSTQKQRYSGSVPSFQQQQPLQQGAPVYGTGAQFGQQPSPQQPQPGPGRPAYPSPYQGRLQSPQQPPQNQHQPPRQEQQFPQREEVEEEDLEVPTFIRRKMRERRQAPPDEE